MNIRLYLLCPFFFLMSCTQLSPRKVNISLEQNLCIPSHLYKNELLEFHLKQGAEKYYGTPKYVFKPAYRDVALKYLSGKLYNDMLLKNLKKSPDFKKYLDLKAKYEASTIAKKINFLAASLDLSSDEIEEYNKSFVHHPQSAERLTAIEKVVGNSEVSEQSTALLMTILLVTDYKDDSASAPIRIYHQETSNYNQRLTKNYLYAFRFRSVSELNTMADELGKESKQMKQIMSKLIPQTDKEFIDYFNQKNKEAGLAPLDADHLLTL